MNPTKKSSTLQRKSSSPVSNSSRPVGSNAPRTYRKPELATYPLSQIVLGAGGSLIDDSGQPREAP